MYGSLPREGLLHHLASQDTHVESLQTLSRKLERNTFAPVVCSILGVVVFMRLGVVVGTLGIWYALFVVSAAFVVTFLTVMSMSALASTGEGVSEAGGGLFNALRRSLGHRLGHLIGLIMYLSFGIGAAFYLLGFSELAMVVVGAGESNKFLLPWNEDAAAATVALASVILAVLMYGVQIRITLRALRLVFVMVMVAVACNVLFLSVPNDSKHTGMSMRHFRENSVEHTPKMFRQMFATFFPGFCGVIAGANLAEYVSERSAARASSAIAKKASQYFLLGIHKALAFSFVIYVGLGCVLAACVENRALETEPLVVPLVVDSVLGVPLIFLGVASTTLSSALSNIKGASTIFTALYDRQLQSKEIYSPSNADKPNASISETVELSGNSMNDQPRAEQKASVVALVSTWVLCQAALLCGTVDAIIPVVSPTFLLTFFLLNFACFFQDLSSTTFRPSFRMYSKWTAFVGCVLSLSAFFLVVSTVFLSVSSVLLLGYTAFYRHELTQFVDELRVSQHIGGLRLQRQDAVDEQILADEATAPLGSTTLVLYAVLGMVLFVDSAEAGTYFKSFEDASLSLIILLTTANFPDVMMPIYSQARVYSLFFISFLMIGQLLVMNLVFASIYQHYRQEIAERAVVYSSKRKLALQAAFHLLPTELVIFTEDAADDEGQIKIVSRRTYNRLVNKLMRPALSLFHDDEPTQSEETFVNLEGSSNEPIAFDEFVVLIKAFIAREKVSTKSEREPRQPSNYAIIRATQCFVARGWFDRAVDLMILGNLVAILVEIQAKIQGDVALSLAWERWMPVFSVAYIVEMLLKIYVFRSGGYFSSAKNIYDCTVTLLIFVAEVSVHSHTSEVEWQWIRLLLLLRFLRCLRLLVALQALSSMFAIVVRLIPAFMTLYGMLGVLMYEYAAAGMQLFGGKLAVGDPRLAAITYGQANFYSNNFNDFASSLTSLFELLIVNNWFVTMEGAVTVTTKWSRIYFVSFYVVGVVMVLSLVVAFVVEAYFEDAARLEAAAHSAKMNAAENTNKHDSIEFETYDPSNSSDKTQRLLRRRSSTMRMRPRADSIYVEEFL
ncbi:hypothetical protein PRNP1_010811 [Phytophthora ramorum]